MPDMSSMDAGIRQLTPKQLRADRTASKSEARKAREEVSLLLERPALWIIT
jgi:hypothetical protein